MGVLKGREQTEMEAEKKCKAQWNSIKNKYKKIKQCNWGVGVYPNTTIVSGTCPWMEFKLCVFSVFLFWVMWKSF